VNFICLKQLKVRRELKKMAAKQNTCFWVHIAQAQLRLHDETVTSSKKMLMFYRFWQKRFSVHTI